MQIFDGIKSTAQQLQNDMSVIYRFLHKTPETGFEITKTAEYISKQLTKLGYSPKKLGNNGIYVTLGSYPDTPSLILRADTDALPIKEQTSLPFASKNGNMHACGHDMHTAMLLGAAKILKKYEKHILGRVCLLFQPAEEILQGAKNMLDSGLCRAVSPSAAFMLHVVTGSDADAGSIIIPKSGFGAASSDNFTLTVSGKGCHGSTPEQGIDPINTLCHIIVALQSIKSMEISIHQKMILTFGQISAGEAPNAIAQKAYAKGSLRTFDPKLREKILRRMQSLCSDQASSFGAKCSIDFTSRCPVLVNDASLQKTALSAALEISDSVLDLSKAENASSSLPAGSEDFAYYCERFPCYALSVSAGSASEGFSEPLHSPKAVFSEKTLATGAALYASLAIKFFSKGR